MMSYKRAYLPDTADHSKLAIVPMNMKEQVHIKNDAKLIIRYKGSMTSEYNE